MRILASHIRPNREHLIVIGFSALNVIAGLISNRVLTQIVKPNPLGELFLFMNLALWLTLPSASVYTYVSRHWSIARAHRRERFFVRRLGVVIGVQGAIAAAGVAGMAPFGLHIHSWQTALALWIAAVGFATNQTFDPIQTMERRRVTAGILAFFGTPARQFILAGGALLLTVQTGSGLLVLQAGYAAFAALATVGALLWLLCRTPTAAQQEMPTAQGGDSDRLSIGSLLAFSTPYLMGAVVTQLCRSAERWGLARHSLDQTAQFVLAVGVAVALVGAVTGHLAIYFHPIIYQTAASGPRPISQAKAPLRAFLLWVTVILGLAVTVMAFASKEITPILFGPRYGAVSYLLPWATLGAALFVLGQALSIISLTARRTIGPNVAFVLSQVLYVIFLVFHAPTNRPALTFARIYALGQAMYVLFMLLDASLSVRAERSAVSVPSDLRTEPPLAATGGPVA